MKDKSPWGGVGLVAFALICCLVPILILSLGAGVLATLMGYWPYALAGFLVIVGALVFIFVRGKVRRR